MICGPAETAVFSGPARVLAIPFQDYSYAVCEFGDKKPLYPWKVFPNTHPEVVKAEQTLTDDDFEEEGLEEELAEFPEWPADK